MHRMFSATLLTALIFVLTACKTGGHKDPAETQPDPKAEACSELSLPIDSAQPAVLLLLEGVPSTWEDADTVAWLEFGEDAEPIDTYIELSGNGAADIALPVHPLGLLDGGDAQLIVHNREHEATCPPLPIHIEALPPAPGTLLNMINELRGALVSRAQTFGYPEEELLSSAAENLPPHVQPLAAGLHMIGGPESSGSLLQVLEDRSLELDGETLSFTEDDLELMDALLAASGFADQVTEIFTEMQDVPDSGTAGTLLQSASSAETPDDQLHPLQEGADDPENMKTPAELAYWMGVQDKCAQVNTDDGLAKQARVIGGVVIAGVALLPNPATPAAALAGLVLTLTQISLDVCENLLPSTLTEIRFAEIGPREFNEDSETAGYWEAVLRVAAREWTLDWPTTVGLIPGAGKLAGVIGKATQQTAAAVEFGGKFSRWLQKMLTTAWQQSDGPLTLRNNEAEIIIDPNRANEDAYFNWYINSLSEEAVMLDPDDASYYVPLTAGESDLHVETRPGAFQNEYASAPRAPIEVRAIEVNIRDDETGEKQPFRPGAGGTIALHAEVGNADDESVGWTANAGDFSDAGENPTVYTAPDAPGIYAVTATSASRSGPRADNDPPRFDTAFIVIGELDILPKPECVETGETVQFEAYIGQDRVDFNELAATVDGPGSMTSDGEFTAGSEGEVTLTVWHPDLEGTTEMAITFEVTQECTGYTITVSAPDVGFTQSGSCIAYSAPDSDGDSIRLDALKGIDDPIEDFSIAPLIAGSPRNPAFSDLKDGAISTITHQDPEGMWNNTMYHRAFPNGTALFRIDSAVMSGRWRTATDFVLDGTIEGTVDYGESAAFRMVFQGVPEDIFPASCIAG